MSAHQHQRDSLIRRTFKVAPNIACIKYWGKRDESLILPLNGSLSVTLSQDDICTVTTAATAPDFVEDILWLNGIKEDTQKNKRLVSCLEALRKRSNAPHKVNATPRS